MSLTTRSISSIAPARVARRAGGSRVIVPESFSGVLERIEAATPSAAVARGPAPVFVRAEPPGDRAVLAQFLSDLAAASDIVGELVALYTEQYPRLAIWFTARAARARADAAEKIEAAARWREVCGATALAELIRAALAIACPPPEPEPREPPVILDVGIDWDDDGLDGL
jgi:hypothetical protein